MSQFNYSDYQANVEKAKNADSGNRSVKVGFFKLADDGDEALVRFAVSSMDDIPFATVHPLQDRSVKFMKVSCLYDFKTHTGSCPFCRVARGDNPPANIGKAKTNAYINMLVSYKNADGSWGEAVPVVWERTGKFATDTFATMLKNYGDLRESLFTITRNGAKGSKDTTYVINYAMPTIFKQDLIAKDFSAFDNFKINKHSYWEKTAEDMQHYIDTGEMPMPQKSDEAPKAESAAEPATTYTAPKAASVPNAAAAESTAATTETPASKPATAGSKYPKFF